MQKRAMGGSQGKVRSIFWDEDDQGFYSGSSDGQVYYWFIEDNAPAEKYEIFSKPGFNISSICACSEGSDKYVYVSGLMPNLSD